MAVLLASPLQQLRAHGAEPTLVLCWRWLLDLANGPCLTSKEPRPSSWQVQLAVDEAAEISVRAAMELLLAGRRGGPLGSGSPAAPELGGCLAPGHGEIGPGTSLCTGSISGLGSKSLLLLWGGFWGIEGICLVGRDQPVVRPERGKEPFQLG